MDGGDYSTTGIRVWIIMLALLGLAATVCAYYGSSFDMLDNNVAFWSKANAPGAINVQQNPLETTAFWIGVFSYGSAVLVALKQHSVAIRYLSLLLIARMICVGISRGFAVPFGGVFHGPNFEMPGAAYYWVGDYITSNFEWLIVVIIFITSLALEQPTLPTLQKVLENIGKQDVLSKVVINLDAEFEPVTNQKQSILIATKKEIFIVPNSTAKGLSKHYVNFDLSRISKLEVARVHNTRWNRVEMYPEEFLELTFNLKNNEQHKRYVFLGVNEDQVNATLPVITQSLSNLSPSLVIKKLKDKKTNSGKKLVSGGGVMIVETWD